MIIKILGTGCANCKRLEANAREAVKQLGVEATVEKVEDIQDIVGYGVMSTPAVVIDGKVVHAGGVPSRDKVEQWLSQAS